MAHVDIKFISTTVLASLRAQEVQSPKVLRAQRTLPTGFEHSGGTGGRVTWGGLGFAGLTRAPFFGTLFETPPPQEIIILVKCTFLNAVLHICKIPPLIETKYKKGSFRVIVGVVWVIVTKKKKLLVEKCVP